jgi:hypothetical protein
MITSHGDQMLARPRAFLSFISFMIRVCKISASRSITHTKGTSGHVVIFKREIGQTSHTARSVAGTHYFSLTDMSSEMRSRRLRLAHTLPHTFKCFFFVTTMSIVRIRRKNLRSMGWRLEGVAHCSLSIDSYDEHTTIEKMHSITGQKFKPSSDQKISSISTKRGIIHMTSHPSQSTRKSPINSYTYETSPKEWIT